MTPGNAAILAVGTELTDGQVINSNAAQLSTWLLELKVQVIEHRSVPDDRVAMREAMRDLLDRAPILIVCGGLGPTADDFTREVLAEVANCELTWDQRSQQVWEQICARLRIRGVTPEANQKQQAWFPREAEIFPNAEGTAAGFALVDWRLGRPSYALALPGPPHEVKHLWQSQVRDHLASWIHRQKWAQAAELLQWRTLGRGEGSLDAELEPALKQWATDSQRPRLATGYRAHAPYVDLKIWLSPPWTREEVDAWMRARFGKLMIGQLESDIIEQVSRLCHGRRVWDRASKGRWLRRLMGASRTDSLHFEYHMCESEPPHWDFAIEYDPSSNRVSWRAQQGETKSALIPALAGAWPSERHGVWISEVAILLAAGEKLEQLQTQGYGASGSPI